MEIDVRLMDKEEMPDDWIVYYCDDNTYIIYREDEIKLID